MDFARLERERQPVLEPGAMDSAPDGRIGRHIPQLEDEPAAAEGLTEPTEEFIRRPRLEPSGGQQIDAIGSKSSSQQTDVDVRERVANGNRHDRPYRPRRGSCVVFAQHHERRLAAVRRLVKEARQPGARHKDADIGTVGDGRLDRGGVRWLKPDLVPKLDGQTGRQRRLDRQAAACKGVTASRRRARALVCRHRRTEPHPRARTLSAWTLNTGNTVPRRTRYGRRSTNGSLRYTNTIHVALNSSVVNEAAAVRPAILF